MSLANIDPRQRGLLRLHGWLLMGWACAVGLGASALMLHVFQLHSMAVRYTIGAGAVYFLGFVWGGWWYAKWWNGQRQLAVTVPQHASATDQVAYHQGQEAIRKKFSFFDGLDWGIGGGDDPLSALIAIIVLILGVAFILLFLGYLPLLATDLFAGYMAEIVLEFVIGGLLVRRILKPRPLDDYWSFMVKKTWMAGFLLMLVFGVVGYVVQSANPDAVTLLQLLR